MSIEELKLRYGPSWGIGGRLPLCEEVWHKLRKEKQTFRTMTDEELLAHYGRRQDEQKDGEAA